MLYLSLLLSGVRNQKSLLLYCYIVILLDVRFSDGHLCFSVTQLGETPQCDVSTACSNFLIYLSICMPTKSEAYAKPCHDVYPLHGITRLGKIRAVQQIVHPYENIQTVEELVSGRER